MEEHSVTIPQIFQCLRINLVCMWTELNSEHNYRRLNRIAIK